VKIFLVGVLVGIAVSLAGAFACLRLGMAEVRADIPPSRWESYLMNAAQHASVKREAPRRKQRIRMRAGRNRGRYATSTIRPLDH
jgi:hypothetical protein